MPRSRSTVIQSERPAAARLHLVRQLNRPPNSSNFSVKVIGVRMRNDRKVRRRGISSAKVLINRLDGAQMRRRWQTVLLSEHWTDI